MVRIHWGALRLRRSCDERRANAIEGDFHIASEERRFGPNDAITGALERRITARVSGRAFAVVRAVDLNHEALRGSEEIRDEAPEHGHLPAKDYAQAAPADASPKHKGSRSRLWRAELQLCRRDWHRGQRLSLPARYQQVEQDRAPSFFSDHQQLARPPSGQQRGRCRVDTRDNDESRTQGPSPARSYAVGKSVSDSAMKQLRIPANRFRGDWNYRVCDNEKDR